MGDSKEELLKKILAYKKWRHRVKIADGIVTQGYNTIEDDWEFYGMPDNVVDKSILDIGANDGYYSFEAEKRGAKSVTAIDIYTGNGSTMVDGWSIDGISMLKEYLDSKVEIISKSVFDVKELSKNWDLVFCSDVLSWLDNIQSAVLLISGVCNEKIVIRDTFLQDTSNVPKVEKRKHAKGYFNRMNLAFIKNELNMNGFKKIQVEPIYSFKHFEWQVNNFPAAFSHSEVGLYAYPEMEVPDSWITLNGDWVLSEYDGFVYIQAKGWVKKEDVQIQPRFKSNIATQSIKKWIPDAILNGYLSRNSIEKNTMEYCITATK